MPHSGRPFVLTDVVFEALSGGHFLAQLSHKTQHTAWPKTFLPESISIHYVKHIKQRALSSTQTVTGRGKHSFVLQ